MASLSWSSTYGTVGGTPRQSKVSDYFQDEEDLAAKANEQWQDEQGSNNDVELSISKLSSTTDSVFLSLFQRHVFYRAVNFAAIFLAVMEHGMFVHPSLFFL